MSPGCLSVETEVKREVYLTKYQPLPAPVPPGASVTTITLLLGNEKPTSENAGKIYSLDRSFISPRGKVEEIGQSNLLFNLTFFTDIDVYILYLF